MNDKELIEKKLRGTSTFFKDGHVEFVPQGEGSPHYELAQKVGQVVLQTVRRNDPQILCSPKVNAETDATIAELQQESDKLTVKTWPLSPLTSHL